MAPRIIVVPPSAETGAIAREMAPAGFELVLARGGGAELEAALGPAEYMVCYPNVDGDPSIGRAADEAGAALSAGYDAVDLEAARAGAGLQQRRRQRHLRGRACHHADAHRGAQSALAACQRGGRALARQRPGAAHVRTLRQDAGHRRPRHHRQEGGAAGARLRHAGAVLRHPQAERGCRGRTRRALPPAARAAAHLRRGLAERAAQRLHPAHDRRRTSWR